MKNRLLLSLIVWLTACTTTAPTTFNDSNARWSVMPVHNFSSEVTASQQVEQMIAEIMVSHEISGLMMPPETQTLSHNPLLNQAHRLLSQTLESLPVTSDR